MLYNKVRSYRIREISHGGWVHLHHQLCPLPLMDATSSSYGKLSLQPTVPHEHDPSEHTARPGNAQRHAMWLSTTQQQQDDTDWLQMK